VHWLDDEQKQNQLSVPKDMAVNWKCLSKVSCSQRWKSS
jgi:hypothetical protein